MTAQKYTEAQIQDAMALRERGLSYGQIATRVEMTAKAVSHHCLMRGVDSPRTADKPTVNSNPRTYFRNGVMVREFTPEEDRKILDWALAGMSRYKMARRLGRANNSVTARLATLARNEQRAEKASGVEI